MTPEEIVRRHEAQHGRNFDGSAISFCLACRTHWPCDAVTLFSLLAAKDRELFDYSQRERQWNESELMKSNLAWAEEAKKVNALLAAERQRADSIAFELRGLEMIRLKDNEYLLMRAEAAEARAEGYLDILQAIIYASDQCRGHRDCGHSLEPWQRARRALAPSPTGQPEEKTS